MSRAWRIEFDGALYHVLARGNARQDIFTDDRDRLLFIDLIGEMAVRFEIDVYAWVLMGNHYHLLLKTNRPIYPKACSGLVRITPANTISAIKEAAIYFKDGLKVF